MTESGTMFAAAVATSIIVVMLIAFKFNFNRLVDKFKTKEGKSIALGIVLFTGIALLFSLIGCTPAHAEKLRGQWFSYTEIYVGLDSTFDQSPQCKQGDVSSRVTSNGGFRQNVYESFDSRFHANLKYTHHSCAFDPDRDSYDAIGFEFTYRFWDR